MKKVQFLLILLLVIISINTAAALLTPESGKIPFQVRNAGRIIIGQVTDVDQSFSHTVVTVQVDEWLMNPLPAKVITLRTEGGTNVWVEDQPAFETGEDVLLMLKDENVDKNKFRVLAGAPGKHPVSDRDAVLQAVYIWNQTGEVLRGEIINVDNVPQTWDADLENFNYAVISVLVLDVRPDNFTSIPDPAKYPYLQQAILNINQESWGRYGSVEFHSFKDTALDELLERRGTKNIEINDSYYEVNFIAQDPLAPISDRFNQFFDLKVNNVEKSSTNLSGGEVIKVLYSSSLYNENLKKGELVRVWVGAVEPEQVNRTLNMTLYHTSSYLEGFDVGIIDVSGGNAGVNSIPFISAAGMLAVFIGAVLIASLKRRTK